MFLLGVNNNLHIWKKPIIVSSSIRKNMNYLKIFCLKSKNLKLHDRINFPVIYFFREFFV